MTNEKVQFNARTGESIRWDLPGEGGHCLRKVVDTFPDHINVKSNDRSSGYQTSLDYEWLIEVGAYFVEVAK